MGKSDGKSEKGRLVWNHSTHIPGLIPLLETLLAQEHRIQTVTPGVIASVRSHIPQFRLKVSVPIRGGYKLIARRGKSAQEVFVLTELDQPGLEAAIVTAIQATRRL
nr:DUF2103 domain-containing protein [Leptolyngbya sp. PCC 6406]